MLGMVAKGPVYELLRIPNERAVIIDCVRMVCRERQVTIHPIDPATIPVHAFEYGLFIQQRFDTRAQFFIHGFTVR